MAARFRPIRENQQVELGSELVDWGISRSTVAWGSAILRVLVWSRLRRVRSYVQRDEDEATNPSFGEPVLGLENSRPLSSVRLSRM